MQALRGHLGCECDFECECVCEFEDQFENHFECESVCSLSGHLGRHPSRYGCCCRRGRVLRSIGNIRGEFADCVDQSLT